MTRPYILKKSLGQHFLHDEGVCQSVVAEIDRRAGMQLLEIGPGGGALSKYLMKWDDLRYLAMEVDKEKVAYLERTYPELSGKLLHEDFLKADVPFEGSFSIVGNFPYNISSQILFRILEWEPKVEQMVGMFQKEVAWRVAAQEGSKDYGILSVLLQAYFSVEYLFDVPAHCFTPPPKVVSGVLQLRNLHNPFGISDPKAFKRLVKAAFGQRRKTLRNALRGVIHPDFLTESRFSRRAEQLSVAEFVAIYNTCMRTPNE